MSHFALSEGEALTALGCLIGLGGLIAAGQGLRRLGVGASTTRRIVHAGVSLFVVGTPLLFSRPLPVYGLAVLFVLINATARSRRWWSGIHEARPESWGTVAVPLAVLPALAVTWSISINRIFALQAAFLVLAVADPLSSLLGQALGRRRMLGEATWVGSGVFFATTGLLTVSVLLGTVEWSGPQIVGVAVMAALVGTAVEAISRHGWDNLFIVMGVILVLVPLTSGHASLPLLSVALAGGGGFGVLAYWARTLDGPGAVGGGLFAASLIGLGGWAWAVPGFVFFGLSSGLSRLPRWRQTDANSEENDPRTLQQVLANGGVAWVFLGIAAVLPIGDNGLQSVCSAGFLGALAAAAADTWATELGIRGAERPRSVRTLASVPPGTSGAVSLVGTGAAVFGALSVAAAALFAGGLSWSGGAGIVAAGLVGMIVDSIAGATIQAQYRNSETGQIVERPLGEAQLLRGWAVITNEVVNLLGTAAGALAALVLLGG